jgi:hypothetical protein
MEKEYTTICDKCGRKTWYETEQQCHCMYSKIKTCKTCGHSEEVCPPKMVRCTGILRKIENSDLNSDFTPFYHSNERIEVEFTYGKTKEILRGTVGKTTGWKPVYLLMKTRRSLGSNVLLTKNARFLRVVSK